MKRLDSLLYQCTDTCCFSDNLCCHVPLNRLSTIRNADKIFVIDGGRVVEEGTHDQLLESDGLYSFLWSKQSGTS
jgi:ABC-type transport system involved in Fe-S cluster assembly fused permease/ATPase subunit